jgi:hypothetical protein
LAFLKAKTNNQTLEALTGIFEALELSFRDPLHSRLPLSSQIEQLSKSKPPGKS